MSWARQDVPEHTSIHQVSTSGWVKAAAGTLRWSRTCGRPHMFSTALMPCAEAACASMNLPAYILSSSHIAVLGVQDPDIKVIFNPEVSPFCRIVRAELALPVQASVWQRQMSASRNFSAHMYRQRQDSNAHALAQVKSGKTCQTCNKLRRGFW